MEVKPLWEQILSADGKNLFQLKIGPSIPFLIGTYQYHRKLNKDDLNNEICLRKVFGEILETEHCAVGITICPALGVDVIRIATSPAHNPIKYGTLNEYIIRLWDDYGKYIKSHRFSIDKDDHSWREFDADEEIKLKQLKTY